MVRRNKPKNNVQFVKTIMENSHYGAMKQSFVIAALDVYSRMCLTDTVKEVGFAGFISPDLWKAIAQELHDELEDQYSSRKAQL